MIDMDNGYPTLEYFTSNPKGHLLERHVKNNFPNFYAKLMEYPGELKFSERVYWYFNGMTEKPKCPICGGVPKFISFNEGYLQFCSYKCSMQSTERTLKIKNTMLEKYGVENVSQSQEVKDKKKKTLQTHYGVDAPLQSEAIKSRQKRTMLEKYGVGNASQSPDIKEKKKTTTLEHYGVVHPWQSLEIRHQIKNTMLSRYGVENGFLIPGVKEAQTKAFYQKFMNDHPEILSVNCVDGVWTYLHKCIHPGCTKCPGTFEIPANVYNNRIYGASELCTNLLPIDNHHNSGGTLEIFIRQLLDEYHIKYETNNRTILSGKELDIYIPDYKLAIECNGIYWHSLKEPMYHHQKWIACKNQGIQLLTLWEDQIINQPDIVTNIILSRLGIYKHKVGASKCEVKTVSSKESIDFLRINHLQGSVAGSIRLGLYHKNELVSLMVFGRKRAALGNRDHDQWELYRYCCKQGWQIVGGAKRLFIHFINEHPDVEIESFSSNDISGGGLYDRLGFKQVHIQPYSYWYIDKNVIRHHRYSFRKDVLVKNGADPSLTEFQITDQMGLFRIYDTGQIKWIYDSKKKTNSEEE